MKKILLITAAVLLLLFLGIHYWKTHSKRSITKIKKTSAHLAKDSISEKQRTMEFWELYNQASRLRVAGKPQRAKHKYEKAVKLNPDHRGTLYYLGNIYLRDREYQKAEKDWLKLIKVNPKSARAASQLGNLFFCADSSNPLYQPGRARKFYERASTLNREETGPLLELAKVNLVLGQYDRAKENLEDITVTNFQSYKAYYLLGYLYWRDSNQDKEERFYRKAKKIFDGEYSDEAVAGEGATKSGNAPLLADNTNCDRISFFVDSHLAKRLPKVQSDYRELHQLIMDLAQKHQ